MCVSYVASSKIELQRKGKRSVFTNLINCSNLGNRFYVKKGKSMADPIPPLYEQNKATTLSDEFLSALVAELDNEDIVGNGAAGAIMRQFYLLLHHWLPINTKANFADYFMGATLLFTFILGSALSLTLGAYLWSIGAISVGTVYLIFFYTDLLSTPIGAIQTQLQDLQQAEASMLRIEELFHFESRTGDPGRGIITA